MNQQQVYFVRHKENVLTRHVEHKDVFAYRYQPGWYGWERRGLQKLCFWILRKIGAFYVEPVKHNEITRHVVDIPSFMDRIINQRQILRNFWDMTPRRLLIGSEDYEELMCSEEVKHRFQFYGEYWVPGESGNPKIMGLTIDVIPWMRGILVMPD